MFKYPLSGELPDNGQFVLAHYTGSNWSCSWVVAEFHRDERLKEGNNLTDYQWYYGSGSINGQDVDKWMYLPND